MDTNKEIIEFVKSENGAYPIDIINHISPDFPHMVNGRITYLVNRDKLFVHRNNVVSLERKKDIEQETIIFMLEHDREPEVYYRNNMFSGMYKLFTKFKFKKYIINVSKNSWCLNHKMWKEIFHDIFDLSIHESKILGERLGKYKNIYLEGKFIFED